MFRPLPLFIGLRYTRAKRRNHFISFISFSSLIGIALGVTVLITVLSVMNGFDEDITARVFSIAPHITVSNFRGAVKDWQKLEHLMQKQKSVVAAAPYVNGLGLLSEGSYVEYAMVFGVDPIEQQGVSQIHDKLVLGSLDALSPGSFGIVLAQHLVDTLGLKLGDKVTLMIPKATVTPVGVAPRMKRFTLVGSFDIGSGFEFDKRMGLINLEDAQKLFQMQNTVSGIRLRIKDIYKAPQLSLEIAEQLSNEFVVGNWTQQFGAFFRAIKMEKTMMFLILLLIIAVAAFNLVSSLVMVVTDKQSDIAILRTLGATPKEVLSIFIIQGSILGLLGIIIGLIGGITLSLNVSELVEWLQEILHTQFISADVYFIDYLPSKLSLSDVTHVCMAAFGMSLLATLYPAWRAARTQPAEALRYE